MADRGLPPGLTPRLLSRNQAAAYCGISRCHFDAHVASAVPALEFGRSLRWDIRALDRWLDQRSGFAHPDRPVEDWATMLEDAERR